MDLSVLTSGTVAAAGTTVRTLLIFNDKNVLGAALNNAPTINDHFGTKLPPLLSARAFAIRTKTADQYPDRMKILNDTVKQVFADPDYKAAVLKLKGHWEYINYGNAADCKKYGDDIVEIGKTFKKYLTGK